MSVKETGLPFQDALVRAILDGSKVRTRRIVRPTVKGCTVGSYHSWENGKPVVEVVNVQEDGDPWTTIPCPYVVGDRIWVREAWRIGAWREFEDIGTVFAVDYRSSPERAKTPWIEIHEEDEYNKWRERLLFELHSKGVPYPYRWEPGQAPLAWHPSIHMPRWACRTVLTITSLSLERVQDITEQEAFEEGIDAFDGACPDADICATAKRYGLMPEDGRATFAHLWDSIYASQGLGWNANPWVWNIGWKQAQ